MTERMLALLATLQTGRAFSGAELSSRLGVSARTLRRDIDRLRGYGYPVDTQPGRGGFYRLTAGRALPPLVLDDDEAVATLLGLATLAATGEAGEGRLDEAATRAYGKIDQLLPGRLRPRAAAIRSTLEAAHQLAPAPSPQLLADLADAIRARRTAVFEYQSPTGRPSSRRVEPHRLVHLNLRWYFVAWDVEKQDWRVFRCDRIEQLQIMTSQFEPRPIPADSAVDYLRQGLGKERQTIRLTVHASLTRVADALRHQDADLVAVTDQQVDVTLKLDNWQWLLLNLASLDADFVVHEPPGFVHALRAFTDRLARATARGSSA
ncbi:Helix-turn-helix type 11 domain protein [Kribbella flavida DSM 17836]|uniref:Helix-turn-helix type 11 domain protein n=1 Tax=Kribbella flavida (strain DSM 17836 / JCM 10339 / NBRC 14399) TaxID=479435 RepID=D2Q2S8_KRIFD|nr:Helix-turn-helix type 11 domain protein [Kribbella flavida DSM 17836]